MLTAMSKQPMTTAAAIGRLHLDRLFGNKDFSITSPKNIHTGKDSKWLITIVVPTCRTAQFESV
jgi:hypothetical protein